MWFGEPHPFPKRVSPTRLSTSGQQSYEGWSCRIVNWIEAVKNSVPLAGFCEYGYESSDVLNVGNSLPSQLTVDFEREWYFGVNLLYVDCFVNRKVQWSTRGLLLQLAFHKGKAPHSVET